MTRATAMGAPVPETVWGHHHGASGDGGLGAGQCLGIRCPLPLQHGERGDPAVLPSPYGAGQLHAVAPRPSGAGRRSRPGTDGGQAADAYRDLVRGERNVIPAMSAGPVSPS
ncbi:MULTISPECIES: hypothetical protein [Streptomyces violaceusniger group]|uniref:Uncharacterized protein n=2 Tax=Streptomyces javensis TaxID=114698 RepID=A0ABS0REQ6_9ACTN|nr:hypothetical protein [Streptomyces javensis]MBI0315808.1 hypothetical protein [Streptomyces javensis]